MFFECRCAVCDLAVGPVCGECAGRLRSGPHNDDVRARFVLDSSMREIVAALKYRRERRMARWAAEAMAPVVPALVDAITWVPATPERVKWRGYDQSREIATVLARRLGVPAIVGLARAPDDGRQTSRTRQERALGPALHAQRPISGLVAVVDDVVTTGATMRAARTVLARAGTERTVGVALAATPRRDQGLMQPSGDSSTIRPWKSKSAPSAPKSLLVSRST